MKIVCVAQFSSKNSVFYVEKQKNHFNNVFDCQGKVQCHSKVLQKKINNF